MIFRACRLLTMRWTCLIRVVHLAISLGILATLIFRPSTLKGMLFHQTDLFQGIAYLTVFSISLIIYFYVSLANPGYLPKDKVGKSAYDDTDDEDDRSKMIPSKHADIQLRFCRECLVEQPLRCRHCHDCGRCVCKFDHHCPWIDNCVGERNHSLFLIFLLLESVTIWWTFTIVWTSIQYRLTWKNWFTTNAFLFVDVIVLLLAGFPLFCLLVFHIYLAFSGLTTWETSARERITYLKNLGFDINPFHQGYCWNLAIFCCSRFPYRWDELYRRYRSYSMVPSSGGSRQQREEVVSDEEAEIDMTGSNVFPRIGSAVSESVRSVMLQPVDPTLSHENEKNLL